MPFMNESRKLSPAPSETGSVLRRASRFSSNPSLSTNFEPLKDKLRRPSNHVGITEETDFSALTDVLGATRTNTLPRRSRFTQHALTVSSDEGNTTREILRDITGISNITVSSVAIGDTNTGDSIQISKRSDDPTDLNTTINWLLHARVNAINRNRARAASNGLHKNGYARMSSLYPPILTPPSYAHATTGTSASHRAPPASADHSAVINYHPPSPTHGSEPTYMNPYNAPDTRVISTTALSSRPSRAGRQSRFANYRQISAVAVPDEEELIYTALQRAEERIGNLEAVNTEQAGKLAMLAASTARGQKGMEAKTARAEADRDAVDANLTFLSDVTGGIEELRKRLEKERRAGRHRGAGAATKNNSAPARTTSMRFSDPIPAPAPVPPPDSATALACLVASLEEEHAELVAELATVTDELASLASGGFRPGLDAVRARGQRLVKAVAAKTEQIWNARAIG